MLWTNNMLEYYAASSDLTANSSRVPENMTLNKL